MSEARKDYLLWALPKLCRQQHEQRVSVEKQAPRDCLWTQMETNASFVRLWARCSQPYIYIYHYMGDDNMIETCFN